MAAEEVTEQGQPETKGDKDKTNNGNLVQFRLDPPVLKGLDAKVAEESQMTGRLVSRATVCKRIISEVFSTESAPSTSLAE